MRGRPLIVRALLALSHVIGIRAARDVTIDDDSPLIRYEGAWNRSDRNAFSFGGTHASSTDPTTAKATFRFTGIAVHFLAPLWHIPIAVTLTLDQRPPDVVDLQTPGTPQGTTWEAETSARRWSMTGLDNVSHTLVVTYGRPQNTTQPPAQFTVVDGFTYTVGDETASAATSSSNSLGSSTSSTSSGSPSQTSDSVGSMDNPSDTPRGGSGGSSNSSTTTLIAGLVGALVSTSLIAGIALFILWRRKQKRNAQAVLGVPPPADPGSPDAPPAAIPYPYQQSAAQPNQAVYDPRSSMSEVSGVGNTPVISASSGKRIVLSPSTLLPGSYHGAVGSTTGSSAALLSANPFEDNEQAPPAYSG